MLFVSGVQIVRNAEKYEWIVPFTDDDIELIIVSVHQLCLLNQKKKSLNRWPSLKRGGFKKES